MEEITHVFEYEDGRLEKGFGVINPAKCEVKEGVIAIHEVCKTHRRTSVFRIATVQKRARRHRLPSGESKYISEMTPEEKKSLHDSLARARDARKKRTLLN